MAGDKNAGRGKIRKPRPPAVQIIRHLSEGAYTSFPKAIREVVNNSFDAEATRVDLNFKKGFSELVITDNGTGVPEKAFDEEFLRISGSRRREHGVKSSFKDRPVLGIFGVGVLAIAAVCDEAIVRTTVKGEIKGYERRINFKKFFDKKLQREDLEDHYFSEHLGYFNSKPDEHFTIIRLINLRPQIQDQLNAKEKEARKTRGITGLESFSQLEGIEWFKSELGLLIPVEYEKDFPVYNDETNTIIDASEQLKGFDFHVFANDEEIRKHIKLGRRFSDKFSWEYEEFGPEVPTIGKEKLSTVTPIRSDPGDKVKFFGYIYEQSRQIFPIELRGLLIRVSHVGIKGYDTSFYNIARRRSLGAQANQISGEIFVEYGLDEVLQMDKDDFKQQRLEFDNFIKPIHEKIHEIRKAMGRRTDRVRKGKKAKEKPIEKPTTIRDVLKQKSPFIDEMRKDVGAEEWKKLTPKKLDQTVTLWINEVGQRVKEFAASSSIPEEQSYLEEALKCLSTDCLRATVVLFWNATMHRIHKKIESLTFKAFDDALLNVAKSNIFKWFKEYKPKDCKNIEEFKSCVKDTEAIMSLSPSGLKLLPLTNCEQMLGSFLMLRDHCAHPTTSETNHKEVLYTLEFLLTRILENPDFQV